MKKRVISWLLTVVMVVSLLPTSVLADTLAADQEQQTQQEQIAPADTENTVPAEDEETQEQQEPAEEVPVSRSARSGGAAPMLAAAGAVQDIGTAEAFAAMEPGGNYQLTADIIVTAPYAKDYFTGTFDGNGHTVTLAISGDSDYQALFAKLAAGAVVKNVMVDGEVTGTDNIGGIAGIATNATIIACANKATVAATGRYVGGLVGKGTGLTMTSCYNQGAVSSTRTRPINMGGIAGYVDGGASVENCYNTGSITGSGSNTAAVVGWDAATVKNCYYLESTYKVGACGNDGYTDPTVSKTDAEMRSGDIVALLGSAFMVKSGDYPALSWETPTAAVKFTVSPANAVVEINGVKYTGSCTVGLPVGDYTYTVSCPGYTQQTGSVTVTGEDNPVANPNSVSVTLEKDAAKWVTVTFTVTPENATLTLKDGETQVTPTEGTTYKLLKGVTYTYTAVSDDEGYEPASGEVTPTADGTQTVALKKVQSIAVKNGSTHKTEFEQGDALDTTGLTVTVTYSDNSTKDITEGFTVTGFNSVNVAENQTLTVHYKGAETTYSVKINKKLFPSKAFNALEGYATVEYSHTGKYTAGDGKEFVDDAQEGALRSNSAGMNSTTVTVTITFLENAPKMLLSFDYKVSSESNYDKLLVAQNRETKLTKSGTVAWTADNSLTVKGGDIVTLTYSKDRSTASGSDCIWLKNFTVSPLYTLTIAPNQTDATVTLKDKEGKTVSGSNGVFAVKAAADYTYTVTKKGYEPATGKVTMSAENQTVNVTLVKLPVITLQFTPDDAAVTLKQGNTTVYKESAASSTGKNVYIAAKNTDYTYTVSKFGYETATGMISVATGDVNKTVTLTEAAKYSVTFQITKPEGVSASPTVTVEYNGTKVYEGSGANCTLPAGDYTYKATLKDCDDLSGSFTVAAAAVTVNLPFEKKLTFADIFQGVEGITASNGTKGFKPIKSAAGNYLESNKSYYGTTSLTLTATKPCVISFEYFAQGHEDNWDEDDSAFFTVKKGTTTLLTVYEENGWKTFSTALNTGETLTLSFNENGNSYYVRLKNFAVSPAYTITLTTTPTADKVELKDESGNKLTGSGGKYAVAPGTYTYTVSKKDYETATGEITVTDADVTQPVKLTAKPVITLTATPADATVKLEKGSLPASPKTTDKETGVYTYVVEKGAEYTYTVSKFGYETETGSITVNADVNKTVTLSELASCTLTFAVTPAENAKVTVTHPVGGTIKPEADGGYKLYLGETYAYTVAKADYITVSGSFTAAKNDTITVTLTYAGAGWDGTTKTAPTQDKSGVYLIDTAAKLAWFADAVNGGQKAINGKLTANINLNGKPWTAIGTSSNKFAGTLDGDNYTVSGLVTTGLVGELAEGGVVENLRVNCAIVSTSSLLGGVANSSAGTIRNCMVSGSITFSSEGHNGASAIGGIAGRTTGNGVISGCVSRAVVKDAYDNSTYGTSAPLGGIAGYAYGVVENCYFTGTLAVKKTQPNKIIQQKRGGLVGELNANAELKGSYVAGEFAIADESKFGAVVGKVNSGATITNCAYLDTVAPQAAADGTTSGMTAHTADYMRSAEFAVDMGMNQDDGTLNGGFPVLPWQGGTVLSADDLKAAAAAANALELRGMSAADAAKKAKADWYAETVLGLYDLTDYNDKADLCEKYGIEAPGEAVTNLHDYFLNALQKHFYKELGLDAENADRLKADATGVYQLRGLTPVSGDPEEEEETAQTYTACLTLPASVTVPVEGSGEKIVSLTWTADNALVNTATGALTAPAADKVTVTLTATLQSGAATKVKTFTLCLWSENAEKVQTLEDIAAEFARKNTAVQPLQGVGLYDETNITQAFRRLLAEQGYADVADKAEITYVNGSAKANGFDGTKVQYIADNGDIEYFTGDGTARQTVQYTGLKFNITYAGVTKEITLRATVGRSADAVQKLLESAAGSLNWELIRGENTNGATQSEVAGWTLYTVNDRITSNLTLPSSIAGRYDVKVQWGTRNTEWLYITNGTGVGTVNRPLQPADGTALPEKAGKFRLIARVTYDAFDDYTLAHITGDNGVEVYADVLFDATVAPFDSSVTSEMQNALAEKYQGLLRDFVDKTKPVDTTAVGDDMQMPRPALLEKAGIMTDSYNQKVTMVSLTPDVLDFNGYHAMVYRPLPGEKPVEAKYVVTITTRSSGLLLARQEFSFTIQPFTQPELDGAAAFMTEARTEDAYWDGIKNKNTVKTKVTSDLYPFAEICKNEDGTLKYIRGTVNMTFDGIEADDIPGWLDTEKYRCFRSSRPSVIENELLRVHQPEYNTTVTLDSVLTYTKYAQYWEKFGLNGTEESKERYKDFAQFYKQPIQIDLTVPGTTGQNDPNENQTLTVKVKVDGYNKNGHTFRGISDFTFTGKANEDPTAWDAVKACLDSAKYTYTGSGAYIKSITDAAGHTLKEKGDGKSSGWMFGIAVKGGNETLPKTTLDNTYLKDGDTLRLFFTDTYIPLDPTDPMVPGAEVPGFDEAYAGAKAYIQSAVSAPVVSYLFGEWAVLGQARAKVPLSEAYIAAYYEKVVAYVQKNMGADGVLVDPESRNPTVTDNERIILALTAIGKDPANVGGENLLKALQNKDIMKVTDTSKTDINGLVMGLLALNSRNYTSDTSWLVQAVLEQQNKDGSWRASADTKPVGDVDMTAMALQALAPYYKDGGNETVNTAVKKALNWLSGKYRSGYDSSESCAQVVIALSALNLDANTDARFTKTVEGKTLSVLGNLLQYRVAENGGFKHQFADKAVNEMATEQALCAMAAYARFTEKANALYDMTDAACAHRFGEWKVTVAATCTKDGVSRRICSICGVVEEKPVPATGHNFGAWTVTKAATCTESGISTRKCSVCGTEETMIVPSLGHSMTATAGKAATCTEAGNSAYWTCSRCHKFFSDAAGKTEIAKDSWVIAALGHDEATRAAVAATCYASGHEADTYCKRCGIVITAGATIPATGKHTYVNGVCTVCGVKNPMANVKGDDIKVDSKDNTIVTGGGLTIKTDKPVTDEKLAEIKAAVSDGAITVTVTDTLQLTNEQKAADGGKSALTEAAKTAGDEVKKELNKLAEKLDALRGDKSRKNAQLEKVVDVTVALVKTEGNEIKTVAQLIELPHSVTVTIPITDELYAALQGKRVCVVRSHTDSSGNVTTAELSATLGGTKGNYVLTFQTDKASAFAIVSYETVSSGYYYGGSGTADSGKKDSANTADDSQMVLWLGSAVLAAAAVVVLTRKKRVSK